MVINELISISFASHPDIHQIVYPTKMIRLADFCINCEINTVFVFLDIRKGDFDITLADWFSEAIAKFEFIRIRILIPVPGKG